MLGYQSVEGRRASEIVYTVRYFVAATWLVKESPLLGFRCCRTTRRRWKKRRRVQSMALGLDGLKFDYLVQTGIE
jgi:hypothetical protein